MSVIGPDRRLAWKVLSVVLRRLRDRLPLELAAHLGAQLPLLFRGAYYDQFEPQKQPADIKTLDGLCGEVGEQLRDVRPVDPKDALVAVFTVLSRQVTGGQVAKVQDALPSEIRRFWQAVEARLDPLEDARRGRGSSQNLGA